MGNATGSRRWGPETSAGEALTDILRQGAQRLLATAIETEVAEYIERHTHLRDDKGHRLVVRNGHLPERTLQTSLGSIQIHQPRVRDHRVDSDGQVMRFQSKLLPPYLRRTKSVEALIPWLYLKGISTGDFSEALQALLGSESPGLSATSIVRLKQVWEEDYQVWSRRSLEGKRYVYFWVDGIHCNVRLEEGRPCILVVIGATAEGKKELVAIQDGERESEQSWYELLLDLKKRGLTVDPKLATGDGALGFWKALPKVFPKTQQQRCWVHKMVNVLDKLSKREQPAAKGLLHDIWMSSTREKANKAFDHFVAVYAAKYPKAVECLKKDREELLRFYDFPAEHWIHLRTTNPVESTFATVRLRTTRTKGSGSRVACLTMVFKLVQMAEKHWRSLNGAKLLQDVVKGIPFKDGIKDAA
ncbi:MAG: IS256 family transposase [Planctomycetes bacterium]|nr:IS256 family transposase [Planctomycetota bacterium]